jgi:hypothetical protein
MTYYEDMDSLLKAMNDKLESNLSGTTKVIEKELSKNAKKYEVTKTSRGANGGISDPSVIKSTVKNNDKSFSVLVQDLAVGGSPEETLDENVIGSYNMQVLQESYEEHKWANDEFSKRVDTGTRMDLAEFLRSGYKTKKYAPAKPFVSDTQEKVEAEVESESGSIYSALTKGFG